VLFFDKGTPTQKIWYYQLNLDRNLGKTNPLSEADLAEFVELQKKEAFERDACNCPNAWFLDVATIDTTTYDLSAKNPNKKEETALRSPKAILDEMKALDAESTAILNSILKMV